MSFSATVRSEPKFPVVADHGDAIGTRTCCRRPARPLWPAQGQAHNMNQLATYCCPVIDIGSIAERHEHGRQPAACRPRCSRWSLFDLARMIRGGSGWLRLRVRVTCRDCSTIGKLHVRPPVPTLYPNRAGWISPRQ